MQYQDMSGDLSRYCEKSGDYVRNRASPRDFLTLVGDRELSLEIGCLSLKSGGLESVQQYFPVWQRMYFSIIKTRVLCI